MNIYSLKFQVLLFCSENRHGFAFLSKEPIFFGSVKLNELTLKQLVINVIICYLHFCLSKPLICRELLFFVFCNFTDSNAIYADTMKPSAVLTTLFRKEFSPQSESGASSFVDLRDSKTRSKLLLAQSDALRRKRGQLAELNVGEKELTWQSFAERIPGLLLCLLLLTSVLLMCLAESNAQKKHMRNQFNDFLKAVQDIAGDERFELCLLCWSDSL